MGDLPPQEKRKKPTRRAPISTAAKVEAESWPLDGVLLYSDSDGVSDEQFLDDLSAAIRFKSFLTGTGSGVPDQVLKGLGTLSSAFAKDLRFYDETFLRQKKLATRPWWHRWRHKDK